jgi:hypothetical protein
MPHAPRTPRGHNIFKDLIDDCDKMAATLRSSANQPLDEIRHALILGAFDDLMDSLGKLTQARPKPGDQFDVDDPGTGAVHRDRIETAEISFDDDQEAYYREHGYFEQFNPPARERVEQAMQDLHGKEFKLRYFGERYGWAPIGLIDLIAATVQVAVTGNNDTSTWLGDDDKG